MHHSSLCAVAVALLAAIPGTQAGFYGAKSPVLQVDAKSYDRLIAKSNHSAVRALGCGPIRGRAC